MGAGMYPYPYAENPTRLTRRGWFRSLIDEHPFEISMSVTLVLFGVRSFLNQFESVPKPVSALPTIFVYVYCILAIIGGLSVIVGLVARWRHTWAYGIEGLGLFLSASAWGSYFIGLLFSPITKSSTLLLLALLSLTFACVTRALYLNRRAKTILEFLRSSQTEMESGDDQ